jgi:hypothetical protein
LSRIAAEHPRFFAGGKVESGQQAALPFYRNHHLLRLELRFDATLETVYLLDGGGDTVWLSGESHPIHFVNQREDLQLGQAPVIDYVRFFLFFLRAGEQAFALIESSQELNATGHDDAWFETNRETLSDADRQRWTTLHRARRLITPPRYKEKDEDGRWLIQACIAYEGQLADVTFAVSPSGEIEMVHDEPHLALDGLSGPEYPRLVPAQRPDAEAAAVPPSSDATPAGPDDEEEEEVEVEISPALKAPEDAPRDRDITQAVVMTLLEEAVRERYSNQLLKHFNSETAADRPIERLATMVLGSAPIIVIESDIPFVEEFAVGLLSEANPAVTKGSVVRATAVPGDDTKCDIAFGEAIAQVFLLSFHAYRGLWNAERAAHELSIRNAAVVIGAERFQDVPEPLRRVTDLVLKFRRIDRRVFERIFERVFHAKPGPGWEGVESDWTRYLVPADFHAPRRLGLDREKAVSFLKERVADRLRLVSADVGPKLAELHGLGEARQIAEDLIADIRAAQAGQIPWTAVDRGLLLVGRPGTGKTTLARAIAKECGVKFLVASAAGWQSAGYLDAHLRAIRSDFAEARRFAPSMLFIDELDSIGNRELLSGHNVQYQTEVINALLEQIQGFEAAAPIIVLGATNHVEKVDPALRRAGRLDQLVMIPLPNIPALEQIFRYYLKPYRTAGEVAGDIDERHLAELAFGLTGADVEFFVRGASRRARRERRAITQQDLLAEVTRRPRRPDSLPLPDPDGLRRVAVHEAGHAVARLTGSSKGQELTLITIVPRTDGALGFVASVPREGEVLTRRGMMEEVETVLAGRAAEEVIYGSSDVGLGAGGSSESSDLAVATGMATMMVCQSGLGGNGSLHWTRTPTLAQERQIDELLRKSYRATVTRMAANRDLVVAVSQLLVERQEITGHELRQLLHARMPAARPVVKRNGPRRATTRPRRG